MKTVGKIIGVIEEMVGGLNIALGIWAFGTDGISDTYHPGVILFSVVLVALGFVCIYIGDRTVSNATNPSH